jgi:CDP-4-dehydro-6-deoxyglucose reductase
VHLVKLKNNKEFFCDSNRTILSAAREAGVMLEHSCLTGRCRSCLSLVICGQTYDLQEDLILSKKEKSTGLILSCITAPSSDIELDVEDLGEYKLSLPRTLPAKINSLELVSKDVLKVVLRLPPNANFSSKPGQYVNIIKGDIKRSYSIGDYSENATKLSFYIKNYEGGEMSRYWFDKAKENDLLRIEGPLGTFFYRPRPVIENIILLATGTGIAPILSMLEDFESDHKKFKDQSIILFWGVRKKADLFIPDSYFSQFKNVAYVPVLSRETSDWEGEVGHVQEVLLNRYSDLDKAQVYACGNDQMIVTAKSLLINNGLPENEFFSDSFLCSK